MSEKCKRDAFDRFQKIIYKISEGDEMGLYSDTMVDMRGKLDKLDNEQKLVLLTQIKAVLEYIKKSKKPIPMLATSQEILESIRQKILK